LRVRRAQASATRSFGRRNQILAVESVLAVARYLPSGLKATAVAGDWNRATSSPLSSSTSGSRPFLRSPETSRPGWALAGLDDLRTTLRSTILDLTRLDGAGRKQFEIEMEDRPGQTISFGADNAEIHFWMGHLVVVAPNERKALHFSVERVDKLRRPRTDAPQLDGASALAELDELLRANYELTRIEKAVSIVSKNEQALRLPEGIEQRREETDYQDYGGGGGLGSCGSSCSTTCGDGSNCSATCTAPRCARCSCPASCSCS
jgi:hypothetical protein